MTLLDFFMTFYIFLWVMTIGMVLYWFIFQGIIMLLIGLVRLVQTTYNSIKGVIL